MREQLTDDAEPMVLQVKPAVSPDDLIDLIGEFGREVYYLLDDCETSGPVGEEIHTITEDGLRKVSAILDRIEALRFEEPGVMLGTGAMLQAAIMQTFAHPPQPSVSVSCPAPTPDDETYYSKGKDANWLAALSDEDLAEAVCFAAQDLNDTGLGDDLDKWMPFQAMMSIAADRIKKLITAQPSVSDARIDDRDALKAYIRVKMNSGRLEKASVERVLKEFGLGSIGDACPDQVRPLFAAIQAAERHYQ